MRLATITNWAYGATLALTLASGTSMILASNAEDSERRAFEQRYQLDQATAKLDSEIFTLTAHARQFLNTGDPTYRILYQHNAAALGSAEARVRHLRDAGASSEELDAIKTAIRWADTLHDEQQEALAAHERGDEARGRQILFGPEYERELDRAHAMVERFQYQLNHRTGDLVSATAQVARIWKTVSEIALAITGLLFLFVLYFVFKQRVLKPVVRLSDVVNRLAAQDYAVGPLNLSHIDEIGDMAQAIAVFRENGLARQQLETERDADRVLRDLLSRMTQRMQGCDSLQDLQEIVGRFIPEIAPDLAGRLYIVDPGRNALAEACSWLGPCHSRQEFPLIACWALRRGLAHRPAGQNVDVPCDHLDIGDKELIDTLCLPLSAHGEVFGLLYFEPRVDAANMSATPEVYLTMLAENIGLALANLRLRDQLREMAMADALTGLANRRQLDVAIEEQLARSQDTKLPISCLMVDVDHFKQFNDRFGHDAGDVVLREVGAVLRSVVREGDTAYRYGGEEFLLLLPLDADEAIGRAEEIRSRIAALHVTHDGNSLGPVHASVGLASAPLHCSATRLVHTADSALLRAKAQGRNCVVVAAVREDRSAA